MVRLLILSSVLALYYVYAQYAFDEAAKKEHRTDTGLGLAIMFFILLTLLSISLLVDFVIRLAKKQYYIALTDLPFMLLFLVPMLYINCQMSQYCEDCLCQWLIDMVKTL